MTTKFILDLILPGNVCFYNNYYEIKDRTVLYYFSSKIDENKTTTY